MSQQNENKFYIQVDDTEDCKEGCKDNIFQKILFYIEIIILLALALIITKYSDKTEAIVNYPVYD